MQTFSDTKYKLKDYLRGYGVMTEQTKKQNNIDIMPRQI
jgi:hypothetical protein